MTIMRSLARVVLALPLLGAASCGGTTSSPAEPEQPAATPAKAEGPAPAEPVASADPPAATAQPAAAAPAAKDPKASELIGRPIEEPAPGADDPKKAERDAQLSAAVAMKSGHGKCIKKVREKRPDFKPVRYEVVVTIKPNGAVAKVEADKAKSDVSDPSFVPCVVGKLKEATFPAPGREVTARLLYPD
jgi:hypothetical protein